MQTADAKFRVHSMQYIDRADYDRAVMLAHGQMVIGMSIAQAREVALALEQVADEAEAKLPK